MHPGDARPFPWLGRGILKLDLLKVVSDSTSLTIFFEVNCLSILFLFVYSCILETIFVFYHEKKKIDQRIQLALAPNMPCMLLVDEVVSQCVINQILSASQFYT